MSKLDVGNIPEDVERDMTRCLNLLKVIGLSELRLMACLDVIVTRWKEKMKETLREEMP